MIYVIIIFTDSTLTCSHVLNTLKSMDDSSSIGDMFNVPANKMEELKRKSKHDSQYRTSLVNYYLENHPFTSWKDIGSRLLQVENEALEIVKTKIKPEKGEWVCIIPFKCKWRYVIKANHTIK